MNKEVYEAILVELLHDYDATIQKKVLSNFEQDIADFDHTEKNIEKKLGRPSEYLSKSLEMLGINTSPKLTWVYKIQDLFDEVMRNILLLIIVIVITLFSTIAVSILPFFEEFWEIPYAVGILIFFGSFTIIPSIVFAIKVFLGVSKKR